MKQLVRSITNCKIAGVCGGLGDYFGIDPVIFRAIFLGSVFFGGLGLFTYMLLWLLAPKAYPQH